MGSNSNSVRRAYESAALPYLVAAITTLTALGLRMLLDPVLREQATYLTFFLAVLAASRFGGFLPGLVAAALSALALDWFFIEPRESLAITSPKAAIGLALFSAAAIIISFVVGQLRSAAISAKARSADSQPAGALASPAHESGTSAQTPSIRPGDFRQRPHLTWLGFAILLVVAEAMFFIGTWTRLSERERSSVHTYQVSEQLAAVFSALEDAETGQRGYLLTGREAYLKPYNDAALVVSTRLDKLRGLTANNPDQRKRVDVLDALVASKLYELKETISARRTNGEAAALAIVRTDNGEQLMDQARAIATAMRTAELSLRDQRSASLSNAARGMVVVMLSGIGLLVLVLVGGSRAIDGHIMRQLLDASEQKRTDEALRRSEARFRALVTATSDAVYRMSPDWSEMWHLVGHDFISDTDAPTGEWLRKYIHPNDQARVLAAIREAVRSKSTFELEHRVLRIDGSLGWTFSRAIPMRNGNGEITEWFGAASDITKRKEAEQVLEDSEDQFRTLANAIPQLCWTAKADGWIDWYNERWYRYTGTTPRQMEGWGWQSVHDPAALPEVLERWQASIASGQPFDMVFPLRGADGVFRPFLTRVMPVLDRDGNVARWFGTNTDITEQRRAEEALRTQADLLRLSFDAIIVKQLDGTIETWNTGAERLYGYSGSEAVGRVTHDLLSTVFPKPWPEIRNDLVMNGFWEGELRHRTRGGSEVIVSARKQLIRDANGVERVLVTNRDITQQKSAQEALLASNRRFRGVFQNAAAGINIADWEGRLLESNDAFCSLLGYTRKELAGRHFSTLIPQEDLELNLADTRRLIAGEIQSFQNESRYLRKDGQTVWVQKSVSLIPDSTGRLTNVVVLATDVTVRKQAEAALRESEFRVRRLGDNLPNGAIYRYREDAGGQAHVDFISAGIERITGVPPDDFMADGGTVDRSILPEDLGRMRAAIAQSRDRLTQFEVEIRHKHRVTGEIRWSLLRSTPTRLPDGSTAWDGIEIDITERKLAEEQIQQAKSELEARVHERTAQLEAANKELEAFAYSVSHDLRAPLRGIDGWSLALVEDYSKQLDEKARGYLDVVRSEAQRMGTLIDNMLQLSRITRSQMENEPVDLTAIAQTVAGRLRQTHPGRQIAFSISGGLDGKGDAGLLEIALTNLLGNSVKFTGQREEARIEVGKMERDGQPAFFVRDNGVGFNMASAGKLFGAFQRLHKASQFPGTGIGLATVQRIIHRHGGRVWAEAERGKGATFYFTLESR